MAKKKKKEKFNNPYKIPNDIADEVRRLPNPELVGRAAQEYRNWMGAVRAKKVDGEVQRLKEDIKNVKKDITEHPEIVRLSEELEKKTQELISEELARMQEELKNANQPHNEDIKNFRDLFKLAMDEVNDRRDMGVLKIQ